MREIHRDLAPYWLGGLLQVSSVDGRPTDETVCTADFVALDHLALADEPLEGLRSELGIAPRAA